MLTHQVEHNGERYGAVVQWDSVNGTYHVGSIWNQTQRQYLPLHEIEKEYVRRAGAQGITPLRSRWAARRRIRQYLRIWADSEASSAG